MRKPTRKVKCGKCGFDIVANQIGRHTQYCRGNGPRRLKKLIVVMKSCTYCGIAVEDKRMGAHKISCAQNPRHKEFIEKIRVASTGRLHTKETKLKMSESAKRSVKRRFVRGIRHYITVDGHDVILDSRWEEALARRLDALKIAWIRPEPLSWIDSAGVARRYFPDFYLPEYDLYLDPKNDYAQLMQKEKIEYIHANFKNVKILHSLKECKEFCPISSSG